MQAGIVTDMRPRGQLTASNRVWRNYCSTATDERLITALYKQEGWPGGWICSTGISTPSHYPSQAETGVGDGGGIAIKIGSYFLLL